MRSPTNHGEEHVSLFYAGMQEPEVLRDWNSRNAKNRQIMLKPIRWKRDSTPELGPGSFQTVINQLVERHATRPRDCSRGLTRALGAVLILGDDLSSDFRNRFPSVRAGHPEDHAAGAGLLHRFELLDNLGA